MAADKFEILITLKDRFTRGMNLVKKSLKAVKGSIDRVKKAVFSLKGAFVAFGTGMVAKGFLAVAMSFEKFEAILKTVMGSSIKAKDSMAWISEFTAKTPYELTEVTNSFVKLVSYGFDPTNKALKVLGDTAAAMGKPLVMAVEMFADAATGEFERLKEFGIRAKQQGDKVTFSWVENGEQMVRTAKKTQMGITTALIDVFEKKYAGAMDTLSKTTGGMWSNMKDQFVLFQKSVMDAGIFDHIKAGLSVALEKVNKLKEEGKLDEWAKKAAVKVVGFFKTMTFGTISAYETMAPIMKNFKTMFVSIWEWFRTLPVWVQNAGFIAAIMGGRNVQLTLLILGLASKGIKEIQDEIRVLTYEWESGRSSLENYALKLEALNIVKKRLSKASIFGEDEEEFEERTKELKVVNEQIAIIENQIRQLTPIKIFPEDTDLINISKIRAAATKFYKEIEEAMKKEAEETPVTAIVTKTPKIQKIVPVDLKTEIQKQLLSLEVLYQSGEEELIAYLERRRSLVLLALGAEMGKLKEAAEAEENVNERLKIENQLFIKKQEYALKEIELTKGIADAHENAVMRRKEVEGMLRDLRTRVNEELDTEQAAELAEMDERHQKELEAFKKLLDDKLAAELEYGDKVSAIREVSRQQEVEKDKLVAGQAKQTWDKRLELAGTAATGLKGIFEDLYELGGKKSKSMFKLMKKAAIAEAIINTAKAVSGALGTPPYGLGAIATATLIALKGGLEIAKIKAQEMAGGGLVGGTSPHSKADNIVIKGTAGEFMQPVSAVKHLGLRVMEGIKNNVFPPELFEGFKLPAIARASFGSSYAEGGPITNNSNSDFSVSVPININDSEAAGISGILQQEVEETVIRVMERELR